MGHGTSAVATSAELLAETPSEPVTEPAATRRSEVRLSSRSSRLLYGRQIVAGNIDGLMTALIDAGMLWLASRFLGTSRIDALSRAVTPPVFVGFVEKSTDSSRGRARRSWQSWWDSHVHLRRFLVRRALAEDWGRSGRELDQAVASYLAATLGEHVSASAIRWSCIQVESHLESPRFWVGILAYQLFWSGRLGVPESLEPPIEHDELLAYLRQGAESELILAPTPASSRSPPPPPLGGKLPHGA